MPAPIISTASTVLYVSQQVVDIYRNPNCSNELKNEAVMLLYGALNLYYGDTHCTGINEDMVVNSVD